MRTIRWCCLLGLLALLLGTGRAADSTPAGDAAKVDIKVVKYDGLADVVRGLRGQVVVIDFWGNTCLPCKKNFPHLVEMNRKYAAEGLAAVSVCVNLDEGGPQMPQEKEQALKFLRDKNATFTNLLLDEQPDVIEKRLHFNAIPCVYVFNRAGQWYQFANGVKYDDVEKKVVELLKAK
jgi:thiol-disulfide isomerase/thioredoxin